MSVATARTPEEAVSIATADRQDAGSPQDESRRSILRGEAVDEDERRQDDVEIGHFEVVEATQKYTDELDAFDSFLRIVWGYLSLTDYLYVNRASLTFFVGGDNTVAISAALGRKGYRAAIEHKESVGIPLQVGIEKGRTANHAGTAAKHALETCRQNETRVEETAEKHHGGETDR